MSKDDMKLDLPELSAPQQADSGTVANAKAKNKKANANTKKNGKPKRNIGKYFRDVISELKKVTWAPFKNAKDNNGVLSKTGTVLVVVLFFMLIIAGMDAGLTKLLELLLKAATY
jgi:preprotein translocase SecE subunit